MTASVFPLPDLAALSREQQAVVDSILSRRPSIDGPFLPWLHSPGLASAAERLGAYLRYDTQLSVRESEFAILCVAALANSEGEKRIHGPIARQAGVPAVLVDELLTGTVPEPDDRRLALLADACCDLTSRFRISDATHAHLMEEFGAQTFVEIVVLIGYYTLVAMTLNAFLPSGSAKGG